MKLQSIHLIGIAILLAAAGLVQGTWTNRWSSEKSAESGRDLLQLITEPVADFRPGDFFVIDQANVPEKTHITSRKFLPEKSGRGMTVSLAYGPPGIVAAHTPDVCYLGNGYKLKSGPTKQTMPHPNGTQIPCYSADFEKTTSTGAEKIRVRWTWTGDGTWQTPDYPRLSFMRVPVLYKLYVVHTLSDDEDLAKTDPYKAFAAELAWDLGKQLK
jgi:hypothetical protein